VVQVLHAGGELFVLPVQQHELQGPGEVVEVLAGVVEIHDLGRCGKLGGGDVPDPGCAVAQDGELADMLAPRRMPSAFTRSPNVAAGSKVAT
jgi:hypothetical protein